MIITCLGRHFTLEGTSAPSLRALHFYLFTSQPHHLGRCTYYSLLLITTVNMHGLGGFNKEESHHWDNGKDPAHTGMHEAWVQGLGYIQEWPPIPLPASLGKSDTYWPQ